MDVAQQEQLQKLYKCKIFMLAKYRTHVFLKFYPTIKQFILRIRIRLRGTKTLLLFYTIAAYYSGQDH
jgi:hypothetical protein